jgi:hypothetical protein
MTQVSTVRLHVLRAFYLLNFVGLGFMAWPAVISPSKPFGLIDGVAFSFWAAFGALMGLGVLHPLKLLPLAMLQLLYKLVWLAAVALPIYQAGNWDARATSFAGNFIVPVIVDLLVIPWGYVLAEYFRRPVRSDVPVVLQEKLAGG